MTWIRLMHPIARTMTNESLPKAPRVLSGGDREVLSVYEACDQNANRAAEMLGLQRQTLINILRRIGIEHTAGVPSASAADAAPCPSPDNIG